VAAFFEPVKKVGKTGMCRYALDYLKHVVTTQFLLPFLFVLFLVFEIRVVGTPLRRSDPFKLVEPASQMAAGRTNLCPFPMFWTRRSRCGGLSMTSEGGGHPAERH
jgi:hypothetical protein